jgi:hypothetical protein
MARSGGVCDSRGLGLYSSIGAIGFITAAIAAGVALRKDAGAPVSVAILLGFSGFLITAHPPPFGPTGLGLFVVAVLLYVRSQSSPMRAASLAQPSSA